VAVPADRQPRNTIVLDLSHLPDLPPGGRGQAPLFVLSPAGGGALDHPRAPRSDGLKLRGRHSVEEDLANGGSVLSNGLFREAPPFPRQPDTCPPPRGTALDPVDQAAGLHPGKLMRHPALIPVQRAGQLDDAHFPRSRAAQGDEHAELRLGNAESALQTPLNLKHQLTLGAHPPVPEFPVIRGELPGDFGHPVMLAEAVDLATHHSR
jgi:hypothetical protein